MTPAARAVASERPRPCCGIDCRYQMRVSHVNSEGLSRDWVCNNPVMVHLAVEQLGKRADAGSL